MIEQHDADNQIRALAHRYALALDRRDLDGVSELFASVSRWGRHGVGPGGARSFYDLIWRRFGRSVHNVGTHVIDLKTSTTASGIAYCRAEQQSRDTDAWTTLQFAYHDEYVCEANTWYFLQRQPRFWYRETDGIREHVTEPEGIPQAWDTWDTFWES